MECSKSSSKREFYSDRGLPQETRKTSNKQPNDKAKVTRKRRINEAQSYQKEGNNKSQNRN